MRALPNYAILYPLMRSIGKITKKLGEELQKLKGYELIFYLSLSPFLYEDAILNLGRLLRNFSNPRKVVVEKPFGFDLQSARKLNNLLYRFFVEEEIYRIDHFLGKDTVQNIFSLRFSYIENLRWQGVPFYLMTGKALGKKLTQITIAFREIPKSFVSLLDCMPKQNRIIFQVAPRNFHNPRVYPRGKLPDFAIEFIQRDGRSWFL
jgi:glucose-6-phosphate 1-dehydrogenase